MRKNVMLKYVILPLLICMLFSCNKQKNEQQLEDNNNLQREFVLANILEEDKEIVLPSPSFNEKGYSAYVLKKETEIKDKPKSNSNTIGKISFYNQFSVIATWLEKEIIDGEEGFWCYGKASSSSISEYGWIFSKDLNIPETIDISEYLTDGIVYQNENGDDYIKITIKRHGPDFSNEQFVLKVNTKESSLFYSLAEKKNTAGQCFDPRGTFEWVEEEQILKPIIWEDILQERQ